MKCNICGGMAFGDMKPRDNSVFVRKGVKCLGCGSLERHRLIFELMERSGLLFPPKSVLHLSPEKCLAKVLQEALGEGYLPADKDVDRFRSVQAIRLDLCADLGQLDGRQFDLVLHNHVLEHLPCNYSIVLQKLHSLVKPGGMHVFSLPFMAGGYRESLEPASDESRTERFGQYDHFRVFSPDDFAVTVGMVLPVRLPYSATDIAPAERLLEINFPKEQWHGLNNNSVFHVIKPPLDAESHARS